jgi:hypothetical protein
MNRLIAAVALLVASSQVSALTYNQYTDRTDWQNAVGGAVTEDFEAEPLGGFSDSRVFTYFTATNTNDAVLDTSVDSGAGPANVNGSNYLYFYSNCNATDGMELTFDTPVSAIAFDWRNIDGSGDVAQMVVEIDGETFLFGPPGTGFFGIEATDGTFQTVEIQDTPGQGGCVLEGLGLDDVSIAGDGLAANTRFRVTKTFSDGRDDEVDVHLSCNTGLPLEQDFTISGGGDGVLFVVTEIQGEETVCEVTESGGPAGYTPVFNDGAGCSWTNVTAGGYYDCAITNEADPAEFTVTKEWVIEGAVRDEVIEEAQVAINCSSDILSIDGDEITEPGGSVWVNLSGDGDSVTVTVDTTLGATSCSAYEDVNQSGIETAYTAECGNGQVVVELVAGGSTSCTITNTVFFEGIPTLSQYGMALMALLMLGLGFVGLRRFV